MKRFIEAVKAAMRYVHQTWPFGYLCDFEFNNNRIRVTRNLWVIISGWNRGDSSDALPLNFCSQQLVDRVEKELLRHWFYRKG